MSEPRAGEHVAFVTDDTPEYLEFGDYRGWVLLGTDGTYLRDLTDDEVLALRVTWDITTNGDYAEQGTIWEAGQ